MVSVLESLMKKDSFIHMKLRDCVASVGGEKDCSHVLLPTNALIGPGRHREGDSLRGSRGTRKWLLGLTFFSFFFFFACCHPIFPAQFIEETILYLVNNLTPLL